MEDPENEDKKIVNEFCHMLEKSKQLFNGLSDLPQYGQKQWQAYFGRTFDVYTKLWKFQQQHRLILDTRYHLKRWQIGEIASKIGQLYYHYYLRTSETNYLHEAYSFYNAVRMRAYYSKANKEDRPDLMVKKLRFYARFIVVCLLLKKLELVRDLVRELQKQVDDYVAIYDAEDQLEWSLVLSEIKTFIDSDNAVSVMDKNSSSVVLSHRLSPMSTPYIEKGATIYLKLQEILIVGNSHEQLKFSELTLDMFRMLQSLEREPQDSLTENPDLSRTQTPVENGERNSRRENPHKYLLYKPSYAQLNTFLATGFKELPPGGAMLLYISADGSMGNSKNPEDVSYDMGGVVTNNRKESDAGKSKKSSNFRDMHCLHPGDIYQYTRKPLFVIVDSDNSLAFKSFPNLFGQPLVCLLSPTQVPQTFQDQHQRGNLFTMFLHCPLMAFCYASNINSLPSDLWDKCQVQVDRFITETSKVFARSRNLDHTFMQFYGDDFLRLLMLRYIFCWMTFRLHRGFKGPDFYPSTYPDIPDSDILQNENLHGHLLDLSNILDVRPLYGEFKEID